jgi:hypothetical protein
VSGDSATTGAGSLRAAFCTGLAACAFTMSQATRVSPLGSGKSPALLHSMNLGAGWN